MVEYHEELARYDQAIERAPGSAAAHNNRGLILNKMHRYDEALASYDRALALKPELAELHNNRSATLQAIGRYHEALASCDRAIELKPDFANAHNNRGATLPHLMRYREALASCDRALELRPDFAEAHHNRGVSLLEMGRYEEALASCDQALALKPDSAEAHINRAAIMQQLKRYDDAVASCDRAIALRPELAEAYQTRGLCLVSKGDMREAEAMYLTALALKPNFPDPWFGLTSIRRYRDPDHADAKAIRSLLDRPGIGWQERDCLNFSLGKIYDDCGLYDEAFECFRQANQMRNNAVFYDPGRVAQFTDSIIEVFSREFLAQSFAFASESASPLFIVGMPRSGTTLMAQILSNHSSIASAGELPTILESISMLPELMGKEIFYPEAARNLTPAVGKRLVDSYEKRLRRDLESDVPHVIDKHPLNFRHLGFIAMLFPKARIIHCTRHPLDTGLSNYFQRFNFPYDYSFDLRNIGHFYGEYFRTMEHWRNVLPIAPIEVSYEDMVMKTEQVARETLHALGLEWDERCLAPHTNRNAVDTASKWQVRQPIYQESVDRWRHYEKHLAPLKDLLRLVPDAGRRAERARV